MAKRPTAPRKRVSLICCVITVTPPIPRQRRFQPRPPRHGDDQLWVASWKVLAPVTSTGDVGAAHPDPASCNVTLYEMCARDWGGQVRRGDVVLLQGESEAPRRRHVMCGLARQRLLRATNQHAVPTTVHVT